jgi:hypothetical protein
MPSPVGEGQTDTPIARAHLGEVQPTQTAHLSLCMPLSSSQISCQLKVD